VGENAEVERVACLAELPPDLIKPPARAIAISVMKRRDGIEDAV